MLRELAKYGEVRTDPAYNEDKWWSEALRLSGMAGILPELTIGRLTGPGSQMPWFIPFPAASIITAKLLFMLIQLFLHQSTCL